MAKFLTTSGVSYQVELIIKEAKKKLVLISPYVQISKVLLERLQNASDKGVQIHLIYGKDELKPVEKKQLNSIENLKLYYYQNLHAKCYFNEKTMVVTSMNLYEFSDKHNREMGVLIQKSDDVEMFNDGVEETASIIKSAKIIELENKVSIKLPCIFPLKETDLNELDRHFEDSYNCIVNSTNTYVYCKELFCFGDVMIREGFEIRFFYNLYSEDLLLKKIKQIDLTDLLFKYDIQISNINNSNTKINFISKDASDLQNLIKDYDTIYLKVLSATKNVSYKRNVFF
jgi:hypothetical protein